MVDWLLVPYSIESIWTNRVATCVAVIHDSSLFIGVFIHQYKSRELSHNNKYQLRLYLMTLVTLFSFIIPMVIQLFANFDIFYLYIPCNTSFILSCSAYWFGKYCLWMFSILRIRIVFNSPLSFEYHPYLIHTLIISFTLIYFMANITSVGWCRCTETLINDKYSYCQIQCAMWVAAPNGMGDQIATITCFILFWKRLKLLMNKCNVTKDNQMTYITRKYTVLMATNIMSTWLIMFASTFTSYGVVGGAVDGMINMWTLVLFDKRYDNIYQKVFKCVARTDLLIADNLNTTVENNVNDGKQRDIAGTIETTQVVTS
eukprot:209588_1